MGDGRVIKTLKSLTYNEPKARAIYYSISKYFSGIKKMSKVDIEWQDQFGKWHHLQYMHNEAFAYKSASARAKSTGKRHRLLIDGSICDIIEP